MLHAWCLVIFNTIHAACMVLYCKYAVIQM
jgi:hypothetical protein